MLPITQRNITRSVSMYVRCRSDQTHVKRCKHSHSARLHVKVNGEDDRMTTAVKRSLNEALEERQWRRVRAKGHMSPQSPGASKEGAPKEGCGNFCVTKYTQLL